MPQSLTREANGNCVLRSDNVALRFFAKNGGAPLEWWNEPFPLVTNPFPGSGVSANWELGQDPTQASANGHQDHPICIYSDSSTGIYNYYARESLFNAGGSYSVSGFFPDFWLSAEAGDDAIAPNPDASNTGWRTKYDPGAYAAALNTVDCPVIFHGTGPCWSGLFFVGNETITGPWNRRLRNYGAGRIAFKTNISLMSAAADSFAGVLFRKTIAPAVGLTKHEAFAASGLHLFIYHSGMWSLQKMTAGLAAPLASGQLSETNLTRLLSEQGLQVEVRTNNVLEDRIEIFFENVKTATVQAVGCNKGPHACLFASTSSGTICFGNRQFFHVGVQLDTNYTAQPGGKIVSDMRISTIVPETSLFYRANLPGVFLNQQTFSGLNRRCSKLVNGNWQNITGIYTGLLSEMEAFFIGNNEGTCGVKVSGIVAEVDGIINPGAHLLAGAHVTSNDEFVLMLNPLSASDNVSPRAIRSLRLKANWQMSI